MIISSRCDEALDTHHRINESYHQRRVFIQDIYSKIFKMIILKIYKINIENDLFRNILCLAGWVNKRPIPLFPSYAPLAQQVSEHRPFKAGVLGSNPRRRTKSLLLDRSRLSALGEIPRDRPMGCE